MLINRIINSFKRTNSVTVSKRSLKQRSWKDEDETAWIIFSILWLLRISSFRVLQEKQSRFFFFFLIFCREGMLKWHFLCAVHVSSCQMSTLQSSVWHQVWSERLLHYLTKNSQSLETHSHCVTVCIPPYLFHCYLFSNYSARRIADDNDLCGTDKMLYFIGFFYKLINW